MRYLIYTVLFLFISERLFAQNTPTGSWATVGLKIKFNDRWGTFSELEFRSLSMYNRFYHYEFKAGATYSFQKKYTISAGAAFYNTFKEGPVYEGHTKKKEIGLLEQFSMKQKLSILNIAHRIRLEQRFKKKFANNLRYRLNISVPLNNSKITDKTIFAFAYDEVFFTNQLPHFSRNRFNAGGGYQFNDKVSIKLGWLNQTDYDIGNTKSKNYFFTSFSFNIENNN